VPIYESRNANGSLQQRVSGVSAKPAHGEKVDSPRVTWMINATSLGGLKPRAGDRCRGTDGAWWKVVEVKSLEGGEWPCICEREQAVE
jgi:hypothetical protein